MINRCHPKSSVHIMYQAEEANKGKEELAVTQAIFWWIIIILIIILIPILFLLFPLLGTK